MTSATAPMSTSSAVAGPDLESLKYFLRSDSKSVAEMTLTSSIDKSVVWVNDSRLA